VRYGNLEAESERGIEIRIWKKADARNMDRIRRGFGRKERGWVHKIRMSFSSVSLIRDGHYLLVRANMSA